MKADHECYDGVILGPRWDVDPRDVSPCPRCSSDAIPLCGVEGCQLGGALWVRGSWLCGPDAGRAAGIEWGRPRTLLEYEEKLREAARLLGVSNAGDS